MRKNTSTQYPDRFDPINPLAKDFTTAVGSVIRDFLATKDDLINQLGEPITDLLTEAKEATSGGKRLRPAFCYWGYVGLAGQHSPMDSLLKAASSLDLLHVSLLIHDDIIDCADTRRGRPATHQVFTNLHLTHKMRGDANSFGRAAAIILGDLLSVWHEEMLRTCGLPENSLANALPIATMMRSEVQAGQYLDILMEQLVDHPTGNHALENAAHVVEFKSGRYSVMRPIQLGAALGGADKNLLSQLAEFGSPLGKAFQYRDDLLGVFGDEETTGKPAGDDLREGKRTVLVAHALAQASKADAKKLDAMLGNPKLTSAEIVAGREIIAASGARKKVEEDIALAYEKALEVLEKTPLTQEGKLGLKMLAKAAIDRSH